MGRLRSKFDSLRADIKGDREEIMDKRGVGGSEYHTNKVLESIE